MIGHFPPALVAEFRERGLWRSQTIYDRFESNAEASPTRIAIVDPPNRSTFTFGTASRLTYGELSGLVDCVSNALLSTGLRLGDVLLVQMPNVHELVALYLATAKIGVVISPVPIQYRHGELRKIVDVLKPKGFCSVAKAAGLGLLREFMENVPFSGKLFGFGSNLPDIVVDLSRHSSAEVDLIVTERPSADSLFSICWTSGTEGVPKGVPKTHNNWLSSAASLTSLAAVAPGDPILVPFPFVNAAAIGGLMMIWLSCAGSLVLHHPFNLEVFLQQIASEQVAYTVVAPALMSSLLEIDRPDALSGLRAIGTGSAPPDPSVVRKFEERFGVPVINIFGSNEGVNLCSHPAAVQNPYLRARVFPRDGDEAWTTEGLTANAGRFRLVSEAGHIINTAGEVGEMRIRGPAVFPGYWQNGELDRRGFDADGYFATGDLFEIVEENGRAGYLRFVGRSKELIVRGGMKIAPAELDAVISTHPDIKEAAVVAMSDERLGERVCAFVVPRNGKTVSLAEIIKVCEQAGLARFKWPERLEYLEALPRNALAKVQRRELAQMIADRSINQIEAKKSA